MREFTLSGKTAFVSGGGKGVGAGVVRMLIKQGVNVGIKLRRASATATG